MKTEIKNFNLTQTLECGQCFNFEKISEQEYVVIAKGRALHVRQNGIETEFVNACEEDVRKIWFPYFDIERDYDEIRECISEADERLRPVTEKYSGMRILDQEFPETLISFIISQNKNIPQIKKTVRAVCEAAGPGLGKINGKEYFGFPKTDVLKEMTEQDFRDLKTGFRAPYIMAAIERLAADENFNKKELSALSFEEAKAELVKIKGVGDKVANCVLLFSLGFREAFPVDVWIKRIMEKLYFGKDMPRPEIEALGREKFGRFGGYAQQYLFMYARSHQTVLE